MMHRILSPRAVLIVAAVWLAVPVFSAHAQSPSSIGGRTIQLTISRGSFPFAESGSYRFLPSAVDNAYVVVPITGNVDASSGTHTYAKTGANTARLSLVDDEVGGLTANCTFNTPSSGTYTLSSIAFPGGTQSGTFVLHAGASPASIAGTTITATITSGDFPFADFGSYRFLPSATGNTYKVVALFGDLVDSSGTYSYSKNSDYTGIITFNDSLAGQGLSSQLSFDSPTTGTVFLRKSGSTGYQTAIFSMTTPGVPPSITAHPVSQTVSVGASVTFSVSASGTAPLAYQWRSAMRNISGANLSTYTIRSVQESDSAVYDVVVSNSAGSVTSSGATLFVVAPPSIASHPASMSVLIGNSATFSVATTGSFEPFSYQWRKNQIDIPGANLASYTIGNVQASDAGSYSVRVSNRAGSVNSNPGTLGVILIATEPPIFRTPTWSQTGGFSATLQGQTQTAYRIQWSTNLATWFDLTTFVSDGVLTQIRDSDATAAGMRLYRAVSP